MFANQGPSDDDVRKATVPAFLETEPGAFKPLDECSRSEIQTKIISLTMAADALVDHARNLERYLDSRDS
jgi:hypothetical protein